MLSPPWPRLSTKEARVGLLPGTLQHRKAPVSRRLIKVAKGVLPPGTPRGPGSLACRPGRKGARVALHPGCPLGRKAPALHRPIPTAKEILHHGTHPMHLNKAALRHQIPAARMLRHRGPLSRLAHPLPVKAVKTARLRGHRPAPKGLARCPSALILEAIPRTGPPLAISPLVVSHPMKGAATADHLLGIHPVHSPRKVPTTAAVRHGARLERSHRKVLRLTAVVRHGTPLVPKHLRAPPSVVVALRRTQSGRNHRKGLHSAAPAHPGTQLELSRHRARRLAITAHRGPHLVHKHLRVLLPHLHKAVPLIGMHLVHSHRKAHHPTAIAHSPAQPELNHHKVPRLNKIALQVRVALVHSLRKVPPLITASLRGVPPMPRHLKEQLRTRVDHRVGTQLAPKHPRALARTALRAGAPLQVVIKTHLLHGQHPVLSHPKVLQPQIKATHRPAGLRVGLNHPATKALLPRGIRLAPNKAIPLL